MITNSSKTFQNTSIFSFPTKPRKLNVAKLRHSLSSIFSECPGFLKIKKRTSVFMFNWFYGSIIAGINNKSHVLSNVHDLFLPGI